MLIYIVHKLKLGEEADVNWQGLPPRVRDLSCCCDHPTLHGNGGGWVWEDELIAIGDSVDGEGEGGGSERIDIQDGGIRGDQLKLKRRETQTMLLG